MKPAQDVFGALFALAALCIACAVPAVPAVPADPSIEALRGKAATYEGLYASVSLANPGQTRALYTVQSLGADGVAIDAVYGQWRGTFDGTSASYDRTRTEVAVASDRLNQAAVAMWTELRGGLPTTTFTLESPGLRDPARFPRGHLDRWYRADSAFLRRHHWTPYLKLNAGGPERIVVYQGDGTDVVKLRSGHIADVRIKTLDWDAVIDPADITRRDARSLPGVPAHAAYGHPLGELNLGRLVAPERAKRMRLVFAGHKFQPPMWIPGTPPGKSRSMDLRPTTKELPALISRDMPCTGEQGVWVMGFEYRWTSQASDPRTAALSEILSCPDSALTLRMGPTFVSGPSLEYGMWDDAPTEPGPEICLNLSVRISQTDLGGTTTLVHDASERCATGLLNGSGLQRWAGSELNFTGDSLVLTVKGTATTTCAAGEIGSAKFYFEVGRDALVDFSGCGRYP